MFVFRLLPIIMVTVGDSGQQDDESDGKMAQETSSVSWAAGKCFFLVSFLFANKANISSDDEDGEE